MSERREQRGILAFKNSLRGRLNALKELRLKPALKSLLARHPL
jgi:hypothetical protein